MKPLFFMPIGSADNQQQAPSAQPSPGASRKPMTPSERARHASFVRWGKEQPFAARLEAVRERRKAAKQKKAGGGKGKPAKPTPEQQEAERAKQMQANVDAVGNALNESDNAMLSKNGLAGLIGAANGEEPGANVAQGLIDAGLAVRGEDGRYRLTSDGSAIVRAAESGDTSAVLDRLSAVNDKNVAQAEKEKAKEEKGGGGGGGGSSKPTEEEKEQEKAQKKANNRAAVAAQMAENDMGVSPRGLEALASLASGEQVDEALVDGLAEMGLVEVDSEGNFRATTQGRSAVRAAERGDYGATIDAVSRAKERKAKQEEREQAKRERQAERRQREDERRAKEDERRAQEDGEGGRRQRDDLPKGREKGSPPGPMRPGRYDGKAVKHGAHDQSSHGRRGARGRASGAAYRGARAGGATVQEARAAANDVSAVYANKQRLANIDKQLQGQVSEKQRRSLEAEKARLQADTDMRATRTPAAQTAVYGHDLIPVAPTVRGRMSNEQREWDGTMRTRAQDALDMRAKVDADARRTTDKAELQRLSQRRHELNQIIEGYREQGYVTHEQARAAQLGRLPSTSSFQRSTAPLDDSAINRVTRSHNLSREENRLLHQQQQFGTMRSEGEAQRTADIANALAASRGRERTTADFAEAIHLSRGDAAATIAAQREGAALYRARAGQTRSEAALAKGRQKRELEKLAEHYEASARGQEQYANEVQGILDSVKSTEIDMSNLTPLIEDLEALCNEAQELAMEEEVKDGASAELEEDLSSIKAGRRNNAVDQEDINRGYAMAEELCALFEALGAETGEEETDAPMMEGKSINYDQAAQLVRDAWVQQMKSNGSDAPYPWPQAVFDDGVVISQDGSLYFVPYQRTNEGITFAARDEWRMARQTYITADGDVKAQGTIKGIESLAVDGEEIVTLPGYSIKAIGDGRTEGYLVRFGGDGDLSEWRDMFDRDTDYGRATKSDVWVHHRMLPGLGKRRLANQADIGMDDEGVFIKHLLDLRSSYERKLYDLAQQGKLGWSSGTAPHLVERKALGDGRHKIEQWPLGLDASYTPMPAGGFGVEARASAMKSLFADAGIDLLNAIYDNPEVNASEGERPDEVKAQAERARRLLLLTELELAEATI